jgi:hypothetical protein
MDWPLSIVGLDGLIAPAINVGLTVTVLLAEHTDAVGLPWEKSIAL